MGDLYHGSAAVRMNLPLAQGTYSIRLEAPALARAIRPGQFVMLRLPDASDPLLARPFALYDTVLDAGGEPVAVDVVYLVVGKLTGLLANRRPGEQVQVWGPLGNGFPEFTGLDHVGLVAGGIGQTPFLAYVRQLLGERGYGGEPARRAVERVSLYYGVRTARLAAGVDHFRRAGAAVHLATDDGSLGFHGFVTDLLAARLSANFPPGWPGLEWVAPPESSKGAEGHSSHGHSVTPPQHLVGCGPEPMMKALAVLARRLTIPCHLSLETPMACGIGICFSCVTPVRTEGGWDYRRVCVEGPVFNADCLAWPAD
jgi:dihydroorotate dehydrogenase electron transfer subunit